MIEYKYENISLKSKILKVVSVLIVNMIVIILATKLFRNIYVENIFYTFLTSLILMILNVSIKPIIKFIMLPINVFTLGITYPFVNVIILKLVSLLLGSHFIINGWLSSFVISIFISIMTIIIDCLVGRVIRKV